MGAVCAMSYIMRHKWTLHPNTDWICFTDFNKMSNQSSGEADGLLTYKIKWKKLKWEKTHAKKSLNSFYDILVSNLILFHLKFISYRMISHHIKLDHTLIKQALSLFVLLLEHNRGLLWDGHSCREGWSYFV
jgi:hypothetical protein